MRLSGRVDDWFWGQSLGGGLNSGGGWGGGGATVTDFTLFIRGIQDITKRNSLDWLFGVFYTVFTLSSCIWGGSDGVSMEVIGVRSSM